MKPRVNIKIRRVSEGCYQAFSDELKELSVKGPNVWEVLKTARCVVKQMLGTDEKQPN